ncbi:MAG: SLBB domain-containing protein [Candidatus Margulisbacteria bacterium]|nr:SLBB domain-containing protein [Candidatus Margulisiibacteriota bacterium]
MPLFSSPLELEQMFYSMSVEERARVMQNLSPQTQQRLRTNPKYTSYLSGIDMSQTQNPGRKTVPDIEQVFEESDYTRQVNPNKLEERNSIYQNSNVEGDTSDLSVIEQMFVSKEYVPTFSVDATPNPYPFVFERHASSNIHSVEAQVSVSADKARAKLNKGHGSALSSPVRQFGYDIFQKRSIFERYSFQMEQSQVGPDYILGPGDSLLVYIWGKLEQQYDMKIDEQGRIFLPKIGHISLLGVRFGDVKKVLNTELSQLYTNFEMSVMMNGLRSVSVYVLGDVTYPGTYQIPSFSSVLKALYKASGPTKIGSLRNIKLIRNNKIIATIDLYQYLIHGNRHHDVKLEPNDTIFVPSIGPVALIKGGVKRPAIYELIPQNTVYDLITLGGGLLATSYYKHIQVAQIENGDQQVIKDLSFDSKPSMVKALKKTKLKNGDAVTILPVSETLYKYVTLEGNVKRPGVYAIETDMTLERLIEYGSGFEDDTFLEKIDVFRYISKDRRELIGLNYHDETTKQFKLAQWDVVRVYSHHNISGDQFVSISGSIESPGRYTFFIGMKVKDLVFLSKPDSRADLSRVEVFRRSLSQEGRQLYQLDISKDKSASTQNIFLQYNDEVFVRARSSLSETKRILLSGKINFPGIYMARDGESLSSIIQRAGGLSHNAFYEGAVFTRQAIFKREKTENNKILLEEKKRLFYDQKREGSSETYKEALGFLEEKIKLSKGRLVINLDEIVNQSGNEYDIAIQDGDTLYVPEMPSSVLITGGVHHSTAVQYRPYKNALYYINSVGGFTDYADKRNVMVLKADGSISKKASDVSLGDTVYVPEVIKTRFNPVDFIVKISNNIVTVLGAVLIIGKL